MIINSKKKILFILQDLETGGAEQLKLCVQKYIDKDKYDISYCCIKKIGTIGKRMIKNGGNVICLNVNDKFYNTIAAYRLYKLAKKIRPDLIQSALFNANFFARMAGILIRVPVIIEEHGMYTWKRWYHIFIDKMLAYFTYKVIVPSKSVKDFLVAQEKINSDKIEVLYNCVDLDSPKLETTKDKRRKRLGVRENDFVIGAVGNLRKEKGYDILLDAFKIVLMKYDKTRLFIAGDGYLYDSLVKKAKTLLIEKNIVFLGKCLDISGLLKALDLFVMPSLNEGLGIALLEAAYIGVPCVASEVGGIREIGKELSGIVLVKPNNVKALADAIMDKIKNKAEYKECTSGPKKIKEIFTPNFYIKSLERIYNEALS